MKKYLLLCLLPLSITLVAQKGIQFADASWNELLQQAEKEDKLIFLDAYTTWCGPCKMMVRDVFPDKVLGKYYNEHFINVQLDMESEEGYPIAARYNIRAYPSLFFINGKGESVHQVIGYHDADQLLEVGKMANDPELNLAGLTERYEAGERDADFLLKLTMAHSNAMDGKHTEILESYFETQDDWATPENMELIFALTDNIDSPLFQYLANNRSDFELMFGKTEIVNKLQQIVNQTLYQNGDEMPGLEKVDELYKKAYPDIAERLSSRFRINYYRTAGDQDQFLQSTLDYLEAYPSEDAMELNNAAWNFFELVEDPQQLKVALAWARKSVELEPAYYNYDTLASLYYKIGEKKKAIKTAKHAIEIAKAEGEDYAATQALLDAIKDKNK